MGTKITNDYNNCTTLGLQFKIPFMIKWYTCVVISLWLYLLMDLHFDIWWNTCCSCMQLDSLVTYYHVLKDKEFIVEFPDGIYIDDFVRSIDFFVLRYFENTGLTVMYDQ